MVKIDVIVLIPTLNEANHIRPVLHALLGNDPLSDRSMIVVADGGSTDTTCDIVQSIAADHPNLRLLHNPGRTQAAAMNILLTPEFEGADIAVRCDAHAIYPPGFVADTVAALSAHNVASVVVTMDAVAGHNAGCFRRGLALVADSRLGAGGSPHRGGAASGYVDHGHHAAFRLNAFRALGGYDSSFVANEDAEYDRRLINAGHRIWLASDIRIGYIPRDTPRGLWRQYYRYGQGRAATCLKHRIRPKLRQMIPVVHVLLMIMSLAILPFTLLGFVWPLAYSLLLLGAAVSLAWQHRTACGLVAAPALAIMHAAWGLGFLRGLLKGAPPERTGTTQ
jgi:succinoglycan biosynthesis protein ExoA